jgi:hypothetical protein
MKHEGRADQVGEFQATAGIVFAQGSQIGTGDPFAVLSGETLGQHGAEIAATPGADAQQFPSAQQFGVVKKRVPAENAIFKKHRALIQLLEGCCSTGGNGASPCGDQASGVFAHR